MLKLFESLKNWIGAITGVGKYPIDPKLEKRINEIIGLTGLSEIGLKEAELAEPIEINSTLYYSVRSGTDGKPYLTGIHNHNEEYPFEAWQMEFEDEGNIDNRLLTDFPPEKQQEILSNLERGYRELVQNRQKLQQCYNDFVKEHGEKPLYASMEKYNIDKMSLSFTRNELESFKKKEESVSSIASLSQKSETVSIVQKEDVGQSPEVHKGWGDLLKGAGCTFEEKQSLDNNHIADTEKPERMLSENFNKLMDESEKEVRNSHLKR